MCLGDLPLRQRIIIKQFSSTSKALAVSQKLPFVLFQYILQPATLSDMALLRLSPVCNLQVQTTVVSVLLLRLFLFTSTAAGPQRPLLSDSSIWLPLIFE